MHQSTGNIRMIAQYYIASGILHDYCLGLLSEEKEREVNAMCFEYAEVAQALQLLREALEKYAGSDRILQREELRKVIWEALKKWRDENL